MSDSSQLLRVTPFASLSQLVADLQDPDVEVTVEFLDDPVAVVRRGVESGTIKGEVEWRCELTRVTETGEVRGVLPGSQTWQECFERRIHQKSYSCGWAVVISVSDGGSET